MQNRLKTRLSHYLLLGFVFGIVSLTTSLSHAGLLSSGFTATYEVTHKSIYLGDAVQRFKKMPNGNWEYRSDIKAKGIVSLFIKDTVYEVSEIKKTSDGYRPLSYRYHQHGGKKEKTHNLIFDWTKGQIDNDYTNKQYPLKAGTHDLLSFQIQLMFDLQNNKKSVAYIIADKKRVETYTLKVVKKVSIETPFKTLDALEMISNKIRDKMQFTIWSSPELNYFPVRIVKVDDDGDTTELILKSITFAK
ncbi:hypothetical protein MNBD_GAMMA21-1584 [hydrothermal vent metagenome]|uniref:DUF3108 domain-containing protein n=1 Tax=hydrothermal vent metagenome TaxID=652676 RepID=A0A3B1A8J6_9ZZZZ